MTKEIIKRVFAAGWTNFRRNSYTSFGTTGVMTLVMLLFLGLIALNYLSAAIVANLENKLDVSVYFKTDASEEEVVAVKGDLEELEAVQYIEYISREQAWEDFKKKHAGNPTIQESLTILDENPLPASLNIKAKNPSQYGSIVTFLEGSKLRPLMESIDANEQVIQRIESISQGLQNWGFVSTLVLALIAVLVTFNTIRLTIYNQKTEIEIMRLVGGSNWYIKTPYLIEGSLYGIFAAVFALVVFYPMVHFASPRIETVMGGVSLMSYFVANVWQFGLIILVVGILLGVTSSFVAIRRFLRV